MISLARALRATAAAAVAVATLLVGLPTTAAAAPASTATPSTTRVVEALEWASSERADPLDFNDGSDVSPINRDGTSNLSVADGRVAFDTTAGGFIEPVYQLGIIPHGTDSTLNPIDGNTYTRLSMRIYSGAASNQGGALYWFTCWQRIPGCASARSVILTPGWNTYDFDMKVAPDLMANAAWGPGVTGLRIVPSGSTPSPFHVEVDSVRVYQAGPSVTVTVQGGSGNEVWWDSDSDPTNNGTAASPGRSAGRLATGLSSGGTATFPASAFPPGTYRFYTVQGGQTGAYSAPLTVAPRPQPVMTSPSLTTGADYATTVRGDAWDFSQPSDATAIANFVPTFHSGVMTGFGSGQLNEPQFQLPLSGSVNAAEFHKLTFTVAYDGGFSLANEPGGGMMMRLIWGVDNGAGGLYWLNGQDVVVLPGWQTISYDLRQDPNIIEDEGDPYKLGWGQAFSSQIRAVRFDPHEDPGGRTWSVDDVKLTRDDKAAPGFTFGFTDGAAQPGTTAEIWLDNDRSGFDGTKVLSGLNVVGGQNQATWGGAGVSGGTYWPYLVLRSSDGAVTRRYATGQLQVDVRSGNPIGALDVARAGLGRVGVSGWTIDPDTGIDESLTVHVYSNGQFIGAGAANISRPDVAAAVPGWGSLHGYSLELPAGPGPQNVCAYAINVGPGGNSLLGCRSVTVPTGNPVGALDVARASGPGTIDVAGWALDPDTANPIQVHAYVNGVGVPLDANHPRGDIANAFPGYGPDHGYGATVPARGVDNQVCVYALNTGAGGNSLLGCRNVRVLSGSPVGALDVARASGPGTIDIAGWSLDPDTANPIQVHAYVNGVGVPLDANHPRDDIANAFPGYGPDHGYGATVPARGADNQVCVYALNFFAGNNSLLGCRNVTIPVDPFGALDLAQRTSATTVSVAGWAIDPDSTAPNEVHVYIDGQGAGVLLADRPRSDVGTAFPAHGSNHGFSATLGTSPGPHTLCAYAINRAGSPGSSRLMRCVAI